MRRYILYGHDGSRNHGCEALVRSTISLLNTGRENTVLVSSRPEEDLQYGLDQLCNVMKSGTKGNVSRKSTNFLRAYWRLKIGKDYAPMEFLAEAAGAHAEKNDVALSIGGDTYCYGKGLQEKLAYLNRMWKYNGLKTVLWGCSIEPDLLEKVQIADDIRRYDLITARESISYEALKRINPNTLLVSDPAFLLGKEELPLPSHFADCELVGVNLSPMIEDNENATGLARKNFEKLIEYILYETKMKVLLIPHVVWDFSDDRKVLGELYEKFGDSGRVYCLKDLGCEQLKGYISCCRFFVGARTHATIAAYSCCVPTLVVGYSVKAKGIARDLFGTEDNYVLPVQTLQSEEDLVKAFAWLQDNESNIRYTLQEVMPKYKERAFEGAKALESI